MGSEVQAEPRQSKSSISLFFGPWLCATYCCRYMGWARGQNGVISALGELTFLLIGRGRYKMPPTCKGHSTWEGERSRKHWRGGAAGSPLYSAESHVGAELESCSDPLFRSFSSLSIPLASRELEPGRPEGGAAGQREVRCGVVFKTVIKWRN